jgi:hypothetical protein
MVPFLLVAMKTMESSPPCSLTSSRIFNSRGRNGADCHRAYPRLKCDRLPQCVSLGSELWHEVFDVHAIGEFDQAEFYVVGFCQVTGSGYHAFQPGKIGIGSDQWHLVTVG